MTDEKRPVWWYMAASVLTGVVTVPFAYIYTRGFTSAEGASVMWHKTVFEHIYGFLDVVMKFLPEVAIHPLVDPLIDLPLAILLIVALMITWGADAVLGLVFGALTVIGFLYYYTLSLQILAFVYMFVTRRRKTHKTTG